jgi:superfamily II DNA or RNA helicase
MLAKTTARLTSQLNAFASHAETRSAVLSNDTTFDELVVLPIKILKERFPSQFKSYIKFLRESRRNSPHQNSDQEHATLGTRAAEKLQPLLDGTAHVSLRPHQLEALQALVTFLKSGDPSGLVRLPTGAGKTAVFVTLTQLLDLPTIIVVPKKDLVRQTVREWKKFGGDPHQIGTFYSDNKVSDARTIITTYASLPSLLEKLPAGAEFPVVVCDEAHRSLSSRSREALNRIPGSRIRLGFTATPDFTAVRSARRHFGRVVHEMPLVDAIKSGICSGVRVVFVKTTSKIVGAETGASGDFNQKQLSENLDSSARNRAALAILATPEMQSRSVVVSCLSLKQAHALSAAACDAGLKAGFVRGGMSKSEREKAYQAFEAGELKILFAVDLLTEGWDAPRADTLLNLRPTASRVVAEQRGGRVLRLHPNKEYALVIEFVDDIKGRGRTKAITMVDILNGSVAMPMEAGESRTTDATCNWIRDAVRDHAAIADFEVGITEEEIIRIAADQGLLLAEQGDPLSAEQAAALRENARQTLKWSGFPMRLAHPEISSTAAASAIRIANGKRLGSFLSQYAQSIGKPLKTGTSKRPSLDQMHAVLRDIFGSEYDQLFKPAFSQENPTERIAIQLLFLPVHDMLEHPVSAPPFVPESKRVFKLVDYLSAEACEEARLSTSQLIYTLATTFKLTPLCARLFVDAHRASYGDRALLAIIKRHDGIESISAHEFAESLVCLDFPKIDIPGWAILASFGITSEKLFEDFLKASDVVRHSSGKEASAPGKESRLPLDEHIVQLACTSSLDKGILSKIPVGEREMLVRFKRHASELRQWIQSIKDGSQTRISHSAFLALPVTNEIQALGFPFQNLRAVIIAWDQATATLQGGKARPQLLQCPLSPQGVALLNDFIQFIKKHATPPDTPSGGSEATE